MNNAEDNMEVKLRDEDEECPTRVEKSTPCQSTQTRELTDCKHRIYSCISRPFVS